MEGSSSRATASCSSTHGRCAFTRQRAASTDLPARYRLASSPSMYCSGRARAYTCFRSLNVAFVSSSCQGEAPSRGRLRRGWRALEGARGGGSARGRGNPSARALRRGGRTATRWLDIGFSKETSGRGGLACFAVDSWRSQYRPSRAAQSLAAEGGPAVVCGRTRSGRRSALRQMGGLPLPPRHPADAFQAGQGSRSVHVRAGDATTGAGRSAVYSLLAS